MLNEVYWALAVVLAPGALLYGLRFVYSRVRPHEEIPAQGAGSEAGVMAALRRNPDNRVVRRWGWLILAWLALTLGFAAFGR